MKHLARFSAFLWITSGLAVWFLACLMWWMELTK